ncbi:MAG TPA: SAM-dependent chlorinase/fluorinase [candidate division Zixibacteria bacterium]|nr:SAM-dependent chlorinase/fluorinase [candidate division Zixibacteria bacterium]
MLITLTTDFGYVDPFVGIMKGVIATINPAARVIDITHGIRPQDVLAAALALREAVRYFPPDSIHVVVVDPGVGTERRPLLIGYGGTYLVGPDNGVLSLAFEGREPDCLVCLSNPAYHLRPAAATFHGRDIFAPAAAHLSLGVPPAAFGYGASTFIRLELPAVRKSPAALHGCILYIDGFGNLFTNIREADLADWDRRTLTITVRGQMIRGLASNYAAGASGELIALVNSWGFVEIALFRGSAQLKTGAVIGDPVSVAVGS